MTAKLAISVRMCALAALGAALLAFGGCSHAPRYHYFQPTAAQIGPYPNSYGEAVLPRHGLIAVQGDELAYGLARGRTRWRINGASEGQSAITISQALRKIVKGVKVENRGYPGDTAIRSAVRWQDAPAPNLLILCLGYGDLSAHTSAGDFQIALQGIMHEAQAKGAAVFVVLPPPFGGVDAKYVNGQLAVYRTAASAVARQSGAEVFDVAEAMARIKETVLKTPAQRADVYQAVAADMIPYIKVVNAPQTGQAGSGDSPTVRASADSAS